MWARVAVLVVILLGGATAPAAEMGVYKGAGCVGRDRLPTFTRWLVREPQWIIDFLDDQSWDKFVSSARWISGCWKNSGHRLSLAVPMLPKDHSGTLKTGAQGTYDRTFAEIAAILVANGHADAVLRVGWEFNGGWYPWAAAQDPDSFVRFWRRIATAMRSVPGARFRMEWTPTLGWQQIPPDRVYPGDAYVDVIGMDVYNQSWKESSNTPESRWSELLTSQYGLQWHRDFAKAHGKPMAYPEWGTGTRPDGHGAGDDPHFIERMAAWISANDVLYQAYWDYPAADFDGELSGNRQPASAAAFKRQFSTK